MKPPLRSLRRSLAALALLAALLPGAAPADQWLVYMGGAVASLEDGWTEKRGQVRFHVRNGTLVSVPAHDVDLAASSFITWQLDGRLRPPPRASLSEPDESDGERPPCSPAAILVLRSTETMDVTTEVGRETIHVACLDAPETQHRLPEVAWFGRVAQSAMEIEAKVGSRVCLTEHMPPRRDAEGHRIVYVTLEDGRDYTAATIAGGFGMLRPGICDRSTQYRGIEDRAMERGRGLWSARAEKAALAAVGHSVSLDTGPAPALPPRRSGGG